jgi:hypothetical protein
LISSIFLVFLVYVIKISYTALWMEYWFTWLHFVIQLWKWNILSLHLKYSIKEKKYE